MMSAKRNLSLILMGVIILAFFLPWYKIKLLITTISLSGYGIILEAAKYHSSDNMIMYLINCYSLIPILAVITLLTGIYADKISFLFMIRVTSIITVLLCFVPDILIALNPKSSDIVQIISMFADSGRSFGFYLTIGSAAIALGVTLLRNSLDVSPKEGNTQSQ